jgi:hypothetical protein
MKKLTSTLILACGLFAGGMHQASAAPTMRLSADGGSTWVTITDNGGLDANPVVGVVEYIGPIGAWFVDIDTGFGSPILGSPLAPYMDLGTTLQSSQAASLIVQLSDTGYVSFPSETFIAQSAGFAGGTVTYSAYRDSGNVLFGTTSIYAGGVAGTSPSPTALALSVQGPESGNYQESNSVVVPGGSGSFALTLETVIVHNSATHTSTDSSLLALPQPVCFGKIGDFIWNDINGNGCQDAGEPGIAGVVVDLYAGCGANKGALVKTTTTDSDGKYLFDGLCAGDYSVSITTPNGFVHTVAHSACGGTPGDAHNPLDSNCECLGADNCDVCVNLPTDNSVDLTVDCGYIGTQPCLDLTKTAASTTAMAGGTMVYTYAITNCGGTTFTNLAIIDDNGTPNFPGDDFSVVSDLTLNPGQGASYQATVTLPLVTCVSNSNPSITAGLLVVTVLPSGDIKVTYRQDRGLNDNVYGTPAPADGWSQHKFGDLTGSDKCEFRFTDSTGKVVLDFYSDYISATTSNAMFPSGYASLGPNGGDGSIITGAKSNVLFYTSTLADNLNSGLNSSNGIAFPSPYLVNSPTPESAHPDWDYVDGYTVIVSKNAFGAAGYGGVTVPFQHNSPAKTGNNAVSPVPCGGCVTNIATVVIATNGVIIPGTLASDDAVVCIGSPTPPPPACIITKGAFKIDKNTIQIPLKNAGSAAIVLSEVDLAWNGGVNGKITKMSLNGDFFGGPGQSAASPVALTSGFNADPNRRTIAKGATKTLVITFEKPASKVLTDYTGGTVKFGAGCVVTFP